MCYTKFWYILCRVGYIKLANSLSCLVYSDIDSFVYAWIYVVGGTPTWPVFGVKSFSVGGFGTRTLPTHRISVNSTFFLSVPITPSKKLLTLDPGQGKIGLCTPRLTYLSTKAWKRHHGHYFVCHFIGCWLSLGNMLPHKCHFKGNYEWNDVRNDPTRFHVCQMYCQEIFTRAHISNITVDIDYVYIIVLINLLILFSPLKLTWTVSDPKMSYFTFTSPVYLYSEYRSAMWHQRPLFFRMFVICFASRPLN